MTFPPLPSPEPVPMPGAAITYAIGDIHGQYHKVRKLVERCERDWARRGVQHRKLIFVGDYVDRGPASKDVIQFLIDLQQADPSAVVCLKGNHELILVAAAKGSLDRHCVTLDEWLHRGGGAATLQSYAVSHPAELPADHVDWMESLPLSFDDGQRFFCHAGVHPDLGCLNSREDDLLLIREPFLSATTDFGRLIVHGHTPVPSRRPDLKANRLNMDTGAGYGGPVSAAVLADDAPTPIHFIAE